MIDLDLYIKIGFIAAGASLMMALIGLTVSLVMPLTDRWSRNFFIAFFSVLAVYTLFVTGEGLMDTRLVHYPQTIVIYYVDSLLSTALIPMTTAYLLHCCGESWRHSRLFRVVGALWLVFFVALNTTLFGGWFYSPETYVDVNRGPLYAPMIAIIEVNQISNLVYVIRHKNQLSRNYYIAFLVGLVPMAIALFVHLFVAVFPFFSFGLTVCALSMFGIILVDQITQSMNQQREIAHQRSSIMVLQMRPHFIYNTMMSIYYLCKQDPDLAQQVTLDFTRYLRQNFSAMASQELIPFAEELEHTRAYLAVEQAQFEDGLVVSYDTPHTDFLLPPLTLQPIVENAVKHGMDPDAGPLSILVRTYRGASGSVVVVENDGADFQPTTADDEPHVALENIRQRLRMMCGGSLEIVPREGGGTVVRVTIP